MLNVGWSYFILKVAYQALFSNASIANDARSDGSSDEDDIHCDENHLHCDAKAKKCQ